MVKTTALLGFPVWSAVQSHQLGSKVVAGTTDTTGTTCDNSNYFYEWRGSIMSSEQRQTIITTCVDGVHQVDPNTFQPSSGQPLACSVALNILVYTECQ